ncbi:MAG TPA: hypothetical protein VJI33_03590 [Candidatus Paceibacterota bacterium]
MKNRYRPKNNKVATGHFPGTTNFGGRSFVVATEAEVSALPSVERRDGSGHDFIRLYGDFVEVLNSENGHFVGQWVQGLTVQSGNNGKKLFPRSKTRPLTRDEVGRLAEIIDTLSPSRLQLAIDDLFPEVLQTVDEDGSM